MLGGVGDGAFLHAWPGPLPQIFKACFASSSTRCHSTALLFQTLQTDAAAAGRGHGTGALAADQLVLAIPATRSSRISKSPDW